MLLAALNSARAVLLRADWACMPRLQISGREKGLKKRKGGGAFLSMYTQFRLLLLLCNYD
jgi:hypothetical protein